MSADFADPWAHLRRLTPARVGLGRAGDALPTRAHLDFELCHARARDAVHTALDITALRTELERRLPDREILEVRSRAVDRGVFLQRPDLGAELRPEDEATLPTGPFDLAFILADGLSATALHAHGPATLAAALAHVSALRVAPVVVVHQGRVAIGDPIAQRLGATLSVILLGERPGLSSPDSLGAYLTFAPRPGRSNAERNCISNIRGEGLAPCVAGIEIAALVAEALRQRVTGVSLKDRSARLLPGARSAISPRRG